MKTFAFLKIDSFIDIITNSSSELFVIENKMAVDALVEITNEALKDTGFSIHTNCVELRIAKELRDYESEWQINQALELFPENVREEIKEKYLTHPNWYGISFDRDQIYQSDHDIRGILSNLGYELIDTDY
jgi:hypothetical protein